MVSLQSLSSDHNSLLPTRNQSRNSSEIPPTKTRQILLNSKENFDFFELLAKIKSPCISIPETLIEISKHETLFMSSPKGEVQHKIKNPGKNFFDCKKNVGSPKFIHFAEGETKVIFSEKEAIKCWNSYQGTRHRLHRFLVPQSNTAKKIRVQWRANKPLRAFLVTSSKSFPASSPQGASSPQLLLSGHLHKISQFPYAGQIFSSSFSSFLPHRPVISESHSKNPSNCLKHQADLDSYIAKVSAPDSTIEKVQCPLEVSEMISEFIAISKKEIDDKETKKTLSEALIDFMCEKGKWYMVKVKYYKLDYLPSKIIQPLFNPQFLRRSIVNPELLEQLFSDKGKKKFKNSGLTQTNLIQRLKKIESKHNRMKDSGLKYIDMAEIKMNCLRNYKSNSPTLGMSPCFLKKEPVEFYEKAVNKYEEFRRNLKSSFK